MRYWFKALSPQRELNGFTNNNSPSTSKTGNGIGRIYYPTNIELRVSVMDNAGNEILHFGTYGNRDSMGGLPGDKIPTKGIPLAFPNSVDATDNYIYVADMVNLRLLRLRKNFKMIASSQ